MASSQHRCVFVGNIPYDATEEQLIQICEEVGPVVSFRLVIDRETGKPKGYGFCEYKDEETALSARRNLQGYEINGRQLRVDFAENDKNADRNREQGRGGPGLAENVDHQKQIGGPAVRGDSSLLQPVGLSVAMTAATLMAGALGGAQTGSNPNLSGLQSQPVLGTDPLTLHLAKMSRNQLNEILTEMKVMATQNKEQARQLLLVSPQLLKAVFQAHIMLGMVTPQMLQVSNIRQVPGPLARPPLLDGQQVQQPGVQTLPGLLPLSQNKMHLGFAPQLQGQASAGHPNSVIHSQYAALPQLSVQPRFQTPQLAQNPVSQQATLPGILGVSTIPSLHPQQPTNLSLRPEIQVATSSSTKKQVQPSLLQYPGQIASANLGQNTLLVVQNATLQPSLLTRPPLADNGFQPSSSILSAIPNSANKDSDKPPQFSNDPTWVRKVDTYPSLPSGLYDQASLVNGSLDQTNRPPKLLKLEDGKGASFSAVDVNLSASVSGSSQAFSISRNQVPKAGASDSQKQNSELPPDMDSALLQQVLNLTPEQLTSLPPEQRQQVIQLPQMLRQPT